MARAFLPIPGPDLHQQRSMHCFNNGLAFSSTRSSLSYVGSHRRDNENEVHTELSKESGPTYTNGHTHAHSQAKAPSSSPDIAQGLHYYPSHNKLSVLTLSLPILPVHTALLHQDRGHLPKAELAADSPVDPRLHAAYRHRTCAQPQLLRR